jgi:N-acetylneuraminate synthase
MKLSSTIPPRNARVIAEIGCNHKGDMDIAKEMIEEAVRFCRVDVVKFQKRNPRELLTPEEYVAPHPVPANAFGRTYGEHREALEFNSDQHRELKLYAESLGVDYATSVWDLSSAREIAGLAPKLIKIPSACNGNADMLAYLCDQYPGEVHISLGMTTRMEEEKILKFFQDRGRVRDLVVYCCTSGYPVVDEDVCLLEISRLKKCYGEVVKAIGFSGHHLGISIDIAAMVLGATWIERHFTLDRTWKGTDHAASLEPDGMRRLVRDIVSVSKALTSKSTEILPVEDVQRRKLKRSSNV